jgi:hypothetical protein
MEARGKVLSNPVWKTGMVMGLSDTGKAQVGCSAEEEEEEEQQQQIQIQIQITELGRHQGPM